MNLNILKKLFKREKPSGNNVGLKTIDTSNIKDKRLEEYSEEEQEIVLSYFNKLSLNNYEDLVKFSDNIAKQYAFEQEILKQTIAKYDEEIKFFDKNDYKKDYYLYTYINLSIIEDCEYQITIDNINNIRNELSYRLTALDMFEKRIAKKRPNPLSIFHRAEKLAYQGHIRGIENEKDNIKRLIMQNTINSCVVYKKIEESIEMHRKCDKFKEYQEYISEEYDYEEKIKEYLSWVIVERIKPLLDYPKLWNSFFEEIKTEVIDKEIKRYVNYANTLKSKKEHDTQIIHSIDLTKAKIELEEQSANRTNWLHLLNDLSKDSLKKVYQILAKYLHEYEIEYYTHKDDYKIYLKEMTEIIDKYETTRTKDWDGEYLKEAYERYNNYINDSNSICKYLKWFRDYLSDDIKKEIEKKRLKIEWLYALQTKEKYLTDAQIEDFYPIAKETLTKLENKYGIKLGNNLSDPQGGPISKEKYIKDFLPMFLGVYDLLNGYYEDININYTAYNPQRNIFSNQEFFGNNPNFVSRTPEEYYLTTYLYKKGLYKETDLPSNDHYDLKKYQMNSIYDHEYYFGDIISKILEKKYSDDRILTLPNRIWYDSFTFKFHDLLRGDIKVNKDLMNIEAIYIMNGYLLKKLLKDFYDNFPNKYTYKLLFTTKSALDEVLEWQKDHNVNIPTFISEQDGICTYSYEDMMSPIFRGDSRMIVFPDDYTYEDISNYLNELLERNKVFEKVAN